MGEPGFWDDQQAAAQISSEHSRLSGGSSATSACARVRRRARALAHGRRDGRRDRRRRSAAPKRARPSPGGRALHRRIRRGDAVVTIQSDAGGTDAQDFTEMLLRMYLRWAADRGFKTDSSRRARARRPASSRRRSPIEGENAYGILKAERGKHRLVRLSPFDQAHRRHTIVRAGHPRAAARRRRGGRDRRGRSPHRHLPRERRRRPAREQDRLGGAHHAPPDRIVVQCQNERSQSANKATALRSSVPPRRAAGGGARGRAGEGARRRPTWASAGTRSAATCSSPTSWSRITGPSTRSGTPRGCSTATSRLRPGLSPGQGGRASRLDRRRSRYTPRREPPSRRGFEAALHRLRCRTETRPAAVTRERRTPRPCPGAPAPAPRSSSTASRRSTSRRRRALRRLVRIDKGEFVFVVGASGSGKSTLVPAAAEGARADVGPHLRRRPRPHPAARRRSRSCAATSAASSRTSSSFRTAPPPRTSRTRSRCRARAGLDSAQGARGAEPRRPRAQDELPSRRALRRRAAARLDRARVRQPPAAPGLRRADREPRPRHLGRDHAAPLPDQPRRHDDPDGHPRPRDGRQDAPPRDRARGRQARA